MLAKMAGVKPQKFIDTRAPEPDGDCVAGEIGAGDLSAVAGDVAVFLDGLQEAVLDAADAAVDGAVRGKRILQRVADHAAAQFRGVAVAVEVVGQLCEGVAPIEIIGVDDCEGAVDFVPRRAHGVGGAPGLFARAVAG